ncbi:hypothetical protein MCEMAEM6B_02571 [Mycobacteriaceae bacterium]
MNRRHRPRAPFGWPLLAAGCFASAASVAIAVPAGAEPEPALPAPPPTVEAVLPVPASPVPDPYSPYIAAEETRNNPAGVFTDLIAGANQYPVLAQSATPALPGAAPFQAPSADLLESVSLLMPQNFGMPGDELQNPYALAQGVPPGPFARVDAFQGVRALLHGALGRMPREELGLPLAGTAPPPDAVIPPGLVQFLPPAEEILPPPMQLPDSPPS